MRRAEVGLVVTRVTAAATELQSKQVQLSSSSSSRSAVGFFSNNP